MNYTRLLDSQVTTSGVVQNVSWLFPLPAKNIPHYIVNLPAHKI